MGGLPRALQKLALLMIHVIFSYLHLCLLSGQCDIEHIQNFLQFLKCKYIINVVRYTVHLFIHYIAHKHVCFLYQDLFFCVFPEFAVSQFGFVCHLVCFQSLSVPSDMSPAPHLIKMPNVHLQDAVDAIHPPEK